MAKVDDLTSLYRATRAWARRRPTWWLRLHLRRLPRRYHGEEFSIRRMAIEHTLKFRATGDDSCRFG